MDDDGYPDINALKNLKENLQHRFCISSVLKEDSKTEFVFQFQN